MLDRWSDCVWRLERLPIDRESFVNLLLAWDHAHFALGERLCHVKRMKCSEK